MSAPLPMDEESEIQAAELALGLVEGEDHAMAWRRVMADPDFAAAVGAWEARLAPLFGEIVEAAPGEAVWRQIQAELTPATAAGADRGVVVTLRRRVLAWRGAASLAASLAAALSLALLWPHQAPVSVVRPTPGPPAPLLAANIAGAGPTAVFVAVADPAHGRIVLTPVKVAPTPGKALELWLIPTGGKPIAIGLAASGRPIELRASAAPAAQAGAVMAISVEPPGGSPTGAPTGPVVATGKLQAM